MPAPGQFLRFSFPNIDANGSVSVRWYGSAWALSATDARAGTAGFIGAYRIDLSKQGKGRLTGRKTVEDEERALTKVLESWDGQWPQQIRMQITDSF